jgi:hypothetical protein
MNSCGRENIEKIQLQFFFASPGVCVCGTEVAPEGKRTVVERTLTTGVNAWAREKTLIECDVG